MLALDNPRTRRAYRNDVRDFTAFAGVERPEEMRQVTRAHLIAWRKDLERRGLAPQFHPKKAGRGRLALRPPVRGQRGEPQPGPGRQTAQGRGK